MLSITWNGPENWDYLTESTYQFATGLFDWAPGLFDWAPGYQLHRPPAPSETHYYDSVVDETQTEFSLVMDESQECHLS
jgi:hypothetical protein